MPGTIADLIDSKRKEIEKLKEQIRFLEMAAAAENGALATMGKRPTVLEMAEATLRRHKKAMHSRDICAEIEREYGVRVKPHSLGTMLFRSAEERGKTVYKDKAARNTYGLLEWQ